jgi:uncharacterized membrane-anchored protein YitT (DUF2179 family)
MGGIMKIKRLLLILVGNLISAIGINFFIVPNKLLSGGLTGLALVFNILHPLNVGLIVLLMNIPLFILAWRKLNRDFAIYSLIGAVSLSVFLTLTSLVVVNTGITDILLASLIGGVLTGLGAGIILRQSATSGGTDIIAVLLKGKVAISIPTIGFIINGFIVVIGMILTNVQLGTYTLVSMYVSSYVCNQILTGVQKKKMLIIATDSYEEVASAINSDIRRGSTLLYGEGSFTRNFKCTIYCIVAASELSHTLLIIKQADDQAFVTISEVSEVHGNGFKKPVF